jgi:hypothetical protein
MVCIKKQRTPPELFPCREILAQVTLSNSLPEKFYCVAINLSAVATSGSFYATYQSRFKHHLQTPGLEDAG